MVARPAGEPTLDRRRLARRIGVADPKLCNEPLCEAVGGAAWRRVPMAKEDRMLTVGPDVHQAATVACVLDEGRRTVETVTIRGGWERVVECVGGFRDHTHVRSEASVGYRPLHDGLTRVARRLVAAIPARCV